MNKVDLKV